MSAHLRVIRAGPQMSLQDLGRPGYLSKGLARGGAADRQAHAEGAILLGQDVLLASLEMAGLGGVFEASGAVRIALTGAPMAATVSGQRLQWNASHRLNGGDRLEIGPASRGTYGYLSVGGGFDTKDMLGSRSANFVAGLGKRVREDDVLPVGDDQGIDTPSQLLDVPERCSGGEVRVVPGAQTSFYPEETRVRFANTRFHRDARGNRQGVKLYAEGPPFEAAGQKTVLSEIILPGDIQMTGEGDPFVLLPECQTTGGYPRIGSVLPEDLPIVAQATPGTELWFRFLSHSEADETFQSETERWEGLKRSLRPLVRGPDDLGNLLGLQLISGVTAGGPDLYEEEHG